MVEPKSDTSYGDLASVNREEPVKEDHQREALNDMNPLAYTPDEAMPITDERAAATPSQFPSPAPTEGPSPDPAGTEPTTPNPNKPYWER